MKLLCVVFFLFIFSDSLFSQEFIKNSKVYFKDTSTVEGDFYYYPSVPGIIQVEDSTGKKDKYSVWQIDSVVSKNSLIKNIYYNGSDKLFECVVEGAKLSLYKTFEDDKLKLYVLKDNQLKWLESGKKEVVIDSKIYNKEIYTYKRILKALMIDNADLAMKVDKIKCTEKEVADLIVAYNEGANSFIKNEDAEKKDRKHDWKIYSSYSSYSGTPLSSEISYFGEFGQIGVEYFFSKGSRHSFKFGLEHGNIKDDYNFVKTFNFNLSYYVDFFRSPKCNFYMDVKLANIGKAWDDTESKFYVLPIMGPGIGFEYHLSNKLDVFGEINHILIVKNLLKNYSFGIAYDL